MKVKPSQALGRQGEDLAVAYLEQAGFRPLVRNFRTRFGEIDIVCTKNGEYYFVEVKTRADHSRGKPVENFPWFRQERLKKMAAAYAQGNKISNTHLHLSLLGIDLSGGEPEVTFIADIT
ncbi:MAG: YraN family protein [Deltaproteobacteria bacterium]|nr:YraN family protein [Deltaproteobacteria bacterium]MBI4224531.1 YraN family protein [Deltaproteobacteria bacterium]